MRARPSTAERLGFARARSRGLGRTAALVLLPACGFVGFEGHPSDAGSAPSDSGKSTAMDASPSDAQPPPADATSLDDSGHPVDAAPDAFVDPDPPATQVDDYCDALPKLRRQPVIDGVVDSRLHVLPLMPVGWSSSSPNVPLPDHTTATYALAWLPEGLYVYLRVVDPNRLPPLETASTWQGDGVEIYFDSDGLFPLAPKYDDPGTIQIIVPAPADASTPSTRSMRFRDGVALTSWASARFATFPTPDGYVFEGMVQADAVDGAEALALAANGAVGIDLSVNVSALDDQLDKGGVKLEGFRIGQYFLRTIASSDCDGRPFCNSGAFCSPILVE